MRERRIGRYVVSVVLALAMVMGIAIFAAPAASADTISPSASLTGSGTEGDPYQIGSVADWLCFANMVNGNAGADSGYFQLTKDITFNEGDASDWETTPPAINLADYGGVNYVVGYEANQSKGGNPFRGTFDGNGHVISGVYISKTDGSCGLFGSTAAGYSATIKNVVITNSYYNSPGGEVGAFVGQTSGGTTTIENALVTESVYIKSGAGASGGFIGHNGGNGYTGGDYAAYQSIAITNSACGATVDSTSQNVGGFVGNGNGGATTFADCLFYGWVYGSNSIGGILGINSNGSSRPLTFNDCMVIYKPQKCANPAATCYLYHIQGNTTTKSTASQQPTINYCVSQASETSKLARKVRSGSTGNYFGFGDSDQNAIANAAVLAGFLSTDAGQALNHDGNWSEVTGQNFVWGKVHLSVDSGLCLPTSLLNTVKQNILKSEAFFSGTVEIEGAAPAWVLTAWNSGTVNINTVEKYKEFANFFNGVYDDLCTDGMQGKTLNITADLTFNEGDASTWGTTAPTNDMTDYMIGTASNPFKGTFEGNGHIISGLYIKKTDSSDTAGMFGGAGGGYSINMKDLVIVNSYFEANGCVGALVGQTSAGCVNASNVYVDKDVYIVSGGAYVGGIIGHIGQNGFSFVVGDPAVRVDSCVNAATIRAGSNNNVGGIVGNANNKSVTITNCLNMGNISGGRYVGGILGYGIGGTTSAVIDIQYCVNIGKISATHTNTSKPLGQSCAIACFSTAGTKTATNCFYAEGTANYGVMKGDNKNLTGEEDTTTSSATEIAGSDVPSTLLGYTLPTALENSGNWLARGNGSNINEVCIPIAFEPYTLTQSAHYIGTDVPNWLRPYNYASSFAINTVAKYKEFANFVNGSYSISGNFDGKTVNLTANLNFNNENITAYMIGNAAAKAFKGTFDGQGHTISGVYMFKATSGDPKNLNDTVGLFGFTAAGGNATIQNLLVTNSYFEAEDGAVGSVVAQTAGGVTTFLNIYVTDSVSVISGGNFVGGIIGHNGANGFGNPRIVADSCVNAATVTAEGSDNIGGILGNGNGQRVEISNCLNLGEITGYRYVGGILGRGKANEGVVVTVTGCVNVGQITSEYVNLAQEGAACAIADFGNTARNSITSADCYYVRGSGLRGTFESSSYIDENTTAVSFRAIADAVLVDGLDSDKWTARGVEGEPMTLEVCIPTAVVSFAPATTSYRTTYDVPTWLRGYADTSSFTITTVTQWQQIANYVKGAYVELGDFEGKTVLLGNNLTFTGDMTDYMIGSMTHPFAGTFNGQGYTISGFSVIKSDEDTAGLFGSTAGGKIATIRNLVITNSHFEAAGAVGALIGQTSGGSTVIENVYVTATVELVSTANFVGGLVGHVGQNGYSFIDGEPALNINACVNAANISTEIDDVGGILGNGNQKEIVITNCLNVGDIGGYRYIGGIVGLLSDNGEIANCINAGRISATNYYGDIAAGNVTAGREVTIESCYYTDVDLVFCNAAATPGTVNLSGNIPYYNIDGQSTGWSGWSTVSGGLPVPTALASKVGTLHASANIKCSNLIGGASIRMNDPSGIRFTAKFSKGYLDSLGSGIKKFGIMIAPKIYVDEAEAFTIDDMEVIEQAIGKRTYVAIDNEGEGFRFANASTASSDNYYVFNGVLGNIKEANYNVDFCAIAYVELSNGTALYSDYSEINNCRKVSSVAEAAYNDVVAESTTGYTNLIEDEGDAQNGKYSPYTAAQRAILKKFFYKEEE